MQNSKTYKLYKSAKLWVIGAVSVAVNASTTQVSADTTIDTATIDANTVSSTDGTSVTQDEAKDAVDKAKADKKATYDEARYAFIYHNMSLEYFAKQAKLMVRADNYNSLDIFCNYLEYIDSYNELSALIRNDYAPIKIADKEV